MLLGFGFDVDAAAAEHTAPDSTLRDQWREDVALRGEHVRMLVQLALFARDADHPALVAHRATGGITCGVRGTHLVLGRG